MSQFISIVDKQFATNLGIELMSSASEDVLAEIELLFEPGKVVDYLVSLVEFGHFEYVFVMFVLLEQFISENLIPPS